VTVAKELGVRLTEELPKFTDHHQAKGTTMLDWQAALRTWVRNAAKFQEQADARATRGPGGSFGDHSRPRLALVPNSRASAYVARHGLDPVPIMEAIAEEGLVDKLGLGQAQEILKERLQAAKREKDGKL
jgi:hypothetical protein